MNGIVTNGHEILVDVTTGRTSILVADIPGEGSVGSRATGCVNSVTICGTLRKRRAKDPADRC